MACAYGSKQVRYSMGALFKYCSEPGTLQKSFENFGLYTRRFSVILGGFVQFWAMSA